MFLNSQFIILNSPLLLSHFPHNKYAVVERELNAQCSVIDVHKFPVRSYAYPSPTASTNSGGHIHIGWTAVNNIDAIKIASHVCQTPGSGMAGVAY